jgi:hypothetical protein
MIAREVADRVWAMNVWEQSLHRLYEALQNPHVELRVNCCSHVQRYTKCCIIHNFSKPRVDFMDTLYIRIILDRRTWREPSYRWTCVKRKRAYYAGWACSVALFVAKFNMRQVHKTHSLSLSRPVNKRKWHAVTSLMWSHASCCRPVPGME